MEKRKRKNVRCPKLGARAEKLMLITLPLVLIQAVYTTGFVADQDTYELTRNIDMISLMLERLGLSLILAILGSLFFDMLEKREKKD